MKSYKLSNEGKTFEEKLNKETALNEKLVQKLMKKCVSTPNKCIKVINVWASKMTVSFIQKPFLKLKLLFKVTQLE